MSYTSTANASVLGRFWTGLALAALVACAVFGVRRWRTEAPSAPIPAGTATLGELTLHEGRMVRTGETNAFTGWMEESYPGAGPKSRSWIAAGRMAVVSARCFPNGLTQVPEHFGAGLLDAPVAPWHEPGSVHP